MAESLALQNDLVNELARCSKKKCSFCREISGACDIIQRRADFESAQSRRAAFSSAQYVPFAREMARACKQLHHPEAAEGTPMHQTLRRILAAAKKELLVPEKPPPIVDSVVRAALEDSYSAWK